MTAAFWDKRASRYDQAVSKHDDEFKQVVAWARPLLASTDVVLDFGSGSGEYSLELAGSVDRIHGIDTSGQMIELAGQKAVKRQVPNASFAAVDEFDASIAEIGVTKVVAFNVLHLVAEPATSLARLHELLGPGGLLVSATPCLDEWALLPRLLVKLMQKVGIAPRIVPYTVARLESELQAAGFRIDESKGLVPKHATQWIVATAE